MRPIRSIRSGVTLGLPRNHRGFILIGRFVEGGPRRFARRSTRLTSRPRSTAGSSVGDHDWYWDVNGHLRPQQGQADDARQHQFRPLAAGARPGRGLHRRRCVPFNFFGGAGSITQAMFDYVTFDPARQQQAGLGTSRPTFPASLFELPGGPLGFAVGVEYRGLKGRFDPDPIVAAGFSSDIPALPTTGHYNVKEAYAEINAPLLEDVPSSTCSS